jgi:hypothetical protein
VRDPDSAASAVPPSQRTTEELSELMGELHRNQLWFTYVLASTREQFQEGALAQADSVQKTVSVLCA